jgi:sugar phosphate isomerase/epimerase
MFTTRTGNFPIGLRRGWSDWQKDLSALIAWARNNEFAGIDLGRSFVDVAPIIGAGLKVGSVDLLEWHELMSPDAEKRAGAVARNKEFIEGAVKVGATKFFAVLLPEDPTRPRAENFGYAIESLKALVPTLEANGAQIVLEGYPGSGALACTPEGYRALFNEIPSSSIGINYDPSHLIRMGIDPIRFLKEFVSRVGHVHGKDCEILADDLYEYGWEQPATFKKSPDFGSAAWRYTIPGQGQANWGEIFRILKANGYQGAVGIELEDRDYNGTEAGEKAGLLNSASFLSAC